MASDLYVDAMNVGRIFKRKYDNKDRERWEYGGHLATLAEKAINFSKRSNKPLEECVDIKVAEMDNGVFLIKNYDVDSDILRGFIAGYILESDNIRDDVAIANVCLNTENNFDDTSDFAICQYVDLVRKNIKYWNYKQMGMITLQELTKTCLAMMDAGNKDKYVMNPLVINQCGEVVSFRGVFNEGNIDDCVFKEGIDKRDIILIS